jgi:uncharacterized protein
MPRKLPVLNPENTRFWTGGRDGKLMIHRCDDCQRHFHPPNPVCMHCGGLNVAAAAVSGRGRVISFTINQQGWLPDLPVPYVIAIVGLVEDPTLRLVSNIIGSPPEIVHIDMAVRVVFERHEDVWLPLFQKDDS